MFLELFVRIKPLEHVVARYKVQLVSKDSLVERHYWGFFSLISAHPLKLLQPGVNQLCVFIAKLTQVARDVLHAMRTEESGVVSQAEFDVVGKFFKAPRHVHLPQLVVAVYLGQIASALYNAVQLMETAVDSLAIKTSATKFIVLRETKLQRFGGRERGESHSFESFLLLGFKVTFAFVESLHFVNEQFVALFLFKLVQSH